MKKRMFTALSLLLVAALLISACGSKGESAGTSSGSGSNGKDEEVVTLKFMGWEVSPLETESVMKGLEEFMRQNPNIKVEYTTIPNGTQYVAKMQAMIVGGEAPDVFFLQSDYYRDFVKRDFLLNLDSYIARDFNTDDLIESAINLSTVDGSYYGIESCIVVPMLFYNKEIFDEAGIPYPPSDPNEAWTWEEFVDVAKRLTIRNGNQVEQYGVYGLEDYYQTIALIMSNGGNWFNEDASKSVANTPEVKEVLQKIYDLRVVEGAAPEAKLLTNSGMSSSQMLQTGKIAMLINGSWALQELANMDFEVGTAVLPKFDRSVTHGQAHLHVASKDTKHPEEAWKLIQFLSSEEYQLQNVRAGLWLPNRKSLYTEEGIKSWLTEGVHPEGFEKMIPYFLDSLVYPYAMTASQKIQEDTTAQLDAFFLGGQDLDTTLMNIEESANKNLELFAQMK
jgi:multiple sugar transport system substrate-binding protein